MKVFGNAVRAIAIGGLVMASAAARAESGPFVGMAGVWSGSGTIILEGGATERIRCRATYAVSGDGAGLNQSLTCASDSYKFDLKSDVTAQNGTLTGQWSESSRGVGGTLSGRAGNGQFNVVVTAPAFTANLVLATQGKKQNVTISSEGQFKGAKIALTRS
ncbi:MAG: hypothetical protein JWR73_1115 [Tardiphaga sp.]|jgi:hypothetical protein|nr:hypothetical protein [Tardiphaga sp.]MDB5573675.1 hypothetical protein [Tardiphaga sp.]MDB5625313.1 hypothetical protein [Tardiphaga sp.]MDB5629586.1 hypothetical protein [Tardiphaga sp.]